MLPLLPGCRRGPRETYLTYFDRRNAVSLAYPASWSTDAVEVPENPTYRFFMAPGEKGQKATPTSASLLAVPATTTVDAYAETLIQGATVSSTTEVERQGVKGKAYLYSREPARFGLVLLAGENALQGLFIQTDPDGFRRHQRAIDEMMATFTVERPAAYGVHKNTRFGYSLRLPPSWKQSHTLSNAEMSMVQFLSPALGVDRDGSTVHASLTVTAEPLPKGGLEGFYAATRRKLGDAYRVRRHVDWSGGYADLESIETGVAQSDAKRFYRVSADRGYTLVFEVREDVFHRVSAWCDLIASTFEVVPAGGS